LLNKKYIYLIFLATTVARILEIPSQAWSRFFFQKHIRVKNNLKGKGPHMGSSFKGAGIGLAFFSSFFFPCNFSF